jgi:acyl dehydratase
MSDIGPFSIGYAFHETAQWNQEDLMRGARFLGDQNPLHNDLEAARVGRFGRLIACGPHISGIHACLLPTHCTHLGFEVVGTNFTIRDTGPVFADTTYKLAWEVVAIAAHRSGGHLVDWAGSVRSDDSERPSIEATGQVLVASKA